MSDLDREQIELGIASVGEFDIDNCTCDASVGFYPCRYCAEREAILAGKRVLDQLAEARAELAAMKQKYEPEPGYCEHGVAEGDWCEPCNRAYKEATKVEGGE